METKLDYVPSVLFRMSDNVIVEYKPIKNATRISDSEYCTFVEFETPYGSSSFVGRIYNNERESFYLYDTFYLTKKEAYDAYVKELENQIKELNDKAFKLQMEALDVIGDLNCFMEQYKELEENEKEIKL